MIWHRTRGDTDFYTRGKGAQVDTLRAGSTITTEGKRESKTGGNLEREGRQDNIRSQQLNITDET